MDREMGVHLGDDGRSVGSWRETLMLVAQDLARNGQGRGQGQGRDAWGEGVLGSRSLGGGEEWVFEGGC